MTEKLYNALQICIEALENGETVDSALARFPALAKDLRPMLTASLHARTLSRDPVPEAVQRRARARLLNHAAQMREARHSRPRTWLYTLRPLAIALMVVLFFLSSTGLVNASSNTIPGDGLYPVKRTWEGMRLILTFNEKVREDLEMEYESERVNEIDELLAKGRIESLSFSGYLTARTDTQWTVSGVPVTVTAQTSLPKDIVPIGAAVTVSGVTTASGVFEAHSISLVPAGTPIPTPSPDNDGDADDGVPATESTSSSKKEAGDGDDDSKSVEEFQWAGVIQSINGTLWVVNGQLVNVSTARLEGSPTLGDLVKLEGYTESSGLFVALKVELLSNDDSQSQNGDSTDDHSDSSSGDSSDGDDQPKDDNGDNDDKEDND